MAIRRYMMFVLACLTLSLAGCSYDKDEYFDRLPEPIRLFIVQYYPNPTIDEVTESSDGWYAGLRSGPGFWFGTDYRWITVNGYGMPLPAVFAFDQFPEKLYDYLRETENTENVFYVTRDARRYRIRLLKNDITYASSG